MAAQQQFLTAAAYGAFRSRSMLKAVLRGVADAGLWALPGPVNRFADYVQSRRKLRFAGLRPSTTREATPEPLATFEDLLCKVDGDLNHNGILRLMRQAGTLSEAALHRYLTAASATRRLDLVETALADDSLGYAVVRQFHALRLQQYRGEITASSHDITLAYQNFAKSRLFRDAAANLAADLLARRGDAAELSDFLAQLSPGELTKLSAPTFFGCVRLLTTAGRMEKFAWLQRAYIEALPREQQLYFLEILPPADHQRLIGGPGGWRQALHSFSSVYTARDLQDRTTVDALVLAPLSKIPAGRNDFMNIRFDSTERQRLLTVVKSAISDGRGLALVRLGDGEAYGYESPELPGIPPRLFDDDNLIRERMWWGKTVQDDRRAEIKAQFRQAVASSDIIGVPSIYRIIRDRQTPHSAFGQTGAQRGLAAVLAQLGTGIPLDGKMLTEERCHQLLFDRSSIDSLCRLAKKVVVVSCWTRAQLSFSDAGKTHEIVIPAHTKVAKATGLPAGAPSLSETFEAHAESIESLCEPGTLVLAGAGFLGKIFIARARARGAVALDVGAMLDYFAGYKTRSLADLG